MTASHALSQLSYSPASAKADGRRGPPASLHARGFRAPAPASIPPLPSFRRRCPSAPPPLRANGKARAAKMTPGRDGETAFSGKTLDFAGASVCCREKAAHGTQARGSSKRSWALAPSPRGSGFPDAQAQGNNLMTDDAPAGSTGSATTGALSPCCAKPSN